MFTVPGYVTIDRIFQVFRAYGFTKMPAERPNDEDGDRKRMLRLAQFRAYATNQALKAFLATCPSTSICRADGFVLRISPRFLTWEPPRKPSNSPGSSLWFFDRHGLLTTTAVREWRRWADEEMHRNESYISLLYEDNAPKLAARYRSIQTTLQVETDRLVPLMGFADRFAGAALTILEDHAPRSPEAVRKYFFDDDDSADDKNGGEEAAPVRPKRTKRALVLAAYRKLYPDGHGSRPWKLVEEDLTNDIGTRVKRDTLRRAIGLRSDQPPALGAK